MIKYFKELLDTLKEIKTVLLSIDKKQDKILKRLNEVIKVDDGYHGR